MPPTKKTKKPFAQKVAAKTERSAAKALSQPDLDWAGKSEQHRIFVPMPSIFATQVLFPKLQAWDNFKQSLGASLDDSVRDHLAGTVNEPFAGGRRKRIAVTVIDERGSELKVVKELI